MKLQSMLRLLVTGFGIVGLGIVGCTQTPVAEVRGQTSPAQSTAETAQNSAPAQNPAPVENTTPQTQPPELDVPYVPTPQVVVDEMLRIANVNKDDVLYDLGSGDGRIVITAARKFGTRGVGVDLNPQRVQEATQNAQRAGVSDRVQFRQQDLFDTDFSEATVVTLYLLPQVNLDLRPKLLNELQPGTRIVSHAFDMGDWKPEQVVEVDGKTIYYWTVPERGAENSVQ
ncbi:MAG: class I SAM-dependent methyltransferase [Timaviella obliquedivisa GSE-PSE-MK23-08B]|nr:class I SAM-dependent methyltransferase [Timaviella obliquedivisa GSE-PSE-MK23-08B]